MTTTQTLAERVVEAMAAFPNLSEQEIAAILLAPPAIQTLQSVATPAVPDVTISQIIKVLRDEYMAVELARPRAVLEANGTMKPRNTSTYRTYNTYWKRLEAKHGAMLVRDVTQKLVLEFCAEGAAGAVERHQVSDVNRKSVGKPIKIRDGAQTYNHSLGVFSVVLTYAVEMGYIKQTPLRKVKRRELLPGNRRGLSVEQVEEIMDTALNGGNDPVLDYLLLWTMLETASRVGGLLRLRVGDVDVKNQYIVFHEKGSKNHEHPVTRALASALLQLAAERGSTKPTDPIFRYHPDAAGKGRPMKAKRFETLWNRIQSKLEWVREEEITSHWYRHTSTTFVSRVAPRVAATWAGHTPSDVTSRYTSVTPEELVKAHEDLFGQPHPTLDWTRN
jgi:integrase